MMVLKEGLAARVFIKLLKSKQFGPVLGSDVPHPAAKSADAAKVR